MRTGYWFFWYVVGLHSLWGFLLLTQPAAGGATAPAALVRVFGSPATTGLALLVASGLAIWRLVGERTAGTVHTVPLYPQQLLLLIAAVGACIAIVVGHYADGVERPTAFIMADQAPNILIAGIHVATLMRGAVSRRG